MRAHLMRVGVVVVAACGGGGDAGEPDAPVCEPAVSQTCEDPLGAGSQGLLRDVGLGLRLGNSRSSSGNVLHLDVAFPLDGDPSIQGVQFLVQTKRSF